MVNKRNTRSVKLTSSMWLLYVFDDLSAFIKIPRPVLSIYSTSEKQTSMLLFSFSTSGKSMSLSSGAVYTSISPDSLTIVLSCFSTTSISKSIFFLLIATIKIKFPFAKQLTYNHLLIRNFESVQNACKHCQQDLVQANGHIA